MKTMMAVGVAALIGLPAWSQEADPQKDGIRNKLANQRVTVDFKDVSLDDAVNYLREFAAINIVVDARCADAGKDTHITLRLKDLPLKSVLKLMLGSLHLSAVYREGVLLIVPEGEVKKSTYVQMYDVRDLLQKIEDFPGPAMDLVKPGGPGGLMAGVVVKFGEDEKPPITPDFILEMVKANTGHDSWNDESSCSINLANGVLMVTQSKGVQSEVADLLNRLRQYK